MITNSEKISQMVSQGYAVFDEECSKVPPPIFGCLMVKQRRLNLLLGVISAAILK